jgi:hypothetical protein
MTCSASAGSLGYWVERLAQVGWFIPPFASMEWIGSVARVIDRERAGFGERELEQLLSWLFTSENLATMVVNRYPRTPVIEEFREIIGEGVAAHFLKLDHIAASGLVPVVEGAMRRLAAKQNVGKEKMLDTVAALVGHCKRHVTEKQIGDVGEIISMLESFEIFASRVLFVNTKKYSFSDGTNRHGMAHGLFADAEFGSPLNFYKIMTAINSLTFICSLYYGGSGFAPAQTEESMRISAYYRALGQFALGA